MRLTYKKTLTVLLVVFTSLSLFAQNSFFSKAVESSISVGNAKRLITPERYNLVETNTQDLRNFLWSLPDEKDVMNRANAPIMVLPMPNGSMARFRVWQSSIQEPGLEAKFPEIKTFAGQGIDDPYASIRMDYSPYFGFHAQILSVSGRIYIDPYARGNINYYQSYYHADNKRQNPFTCSTIADPLELSEGVAAKTLAGPCRGTQLYTYRLAVANTGEYANAVGAAGNPAALHAAIVISVNRVTGVYENDLAVRLILVANNNMVEFLDPSTDPFTGNNNGGILLGESQTVITNNIGSGNFDIGHTFSTGGGGIAGLGVVCNTSQKARGITGSPQPFGDGYDIDYVAHEMGHQFGGSHTFNSTTGSCGGGNRSAANAYEVGSGTSIQAYAGICNSDNIQPNSDPYFHAVSFDQISTFVEGGGSCHGTIATGNTIPQITAMDNNNVTIPISTPFTLNATATDGNGDAITYSWEQWDLGTAGTWNSGATSATAPLFKSRIPKTSGSRTFPDINVILAGYPANPSSSMGGMKGETLPQVSRSMKFKVTVRDNRAGGGGITSGGEGCQAGFNGTFVINVSGTTPFLVTFPNGGESFGGGSTQTVTWNNAGTDQAPFNTPNVKISLSTDGGLTYPTVLLASTANDGSENVNLPIVNTTTARIRVEGVSNVFFDISNANFSITGAVPTFDFGIPSGGTVTCGGPTTSSITLPTTSSLGFTTPITLTASAAPGSTNVSFSPNPVTPGNSTTVTLNGVNSLAAGTYDITVTGTAGSIVKTKLISFVVQPGAGPSISTHPTNVSICASGNATFSVASGNATSYQWQVSTDGTNFIDLSGETNASVTIGSVSPSQNGSFYRAIVFGPCGSAISNAAVLNVTAKPTVTLTASQTNLLPGQSTTLTATPQPAGSYTYTWTLDGTPIAGASGNTYTTNVTGAGDYAVNIVQTSTGCNNQSDILKITATASNTLFIFPNPNHGKFQIAYYHSGSSSTQRNVTIFDARGALVYSRTINISLPYQLMDINMISAAAGPYLVVIRDKNGDKVATGTVLVGHH